MRALIKVLNRGTRRLDRWTYTHPYRVFWVCLVGFVLVALFLAFYGAAIDRAVAAPIMGITT